MKFPQNLRKEIHDENLKYLYTTNHKLTFKNLSSIILVCIKV